MLSKKNTTAKQDATRTNAAKGAARTATDAKAANATTRARAASTPRRVSDDKNAAKDGHTPTADHLKEGEKSDTAVGPEAGPPLPPPAPIPVATKPETVTADDVATRKALDDAEADQQKAAGTDAETRTKKAHAAARKAHGGEHDRHDCLMHCAAEIMSGSITISAADAARRAVELETEVQKAIAEQDERLKAEKDGDDAKDKTK
jgi:hypothetical protein